MSVITAKINCKVVDKRRSNGFLWNNYYCTFQMTGEQDIQIRGGQKTFEINVPAEQYYDLNIGDLIKITLYRHSNGLYYTQQE